MAQPSEPPSKLPEIPQYLFDENAGAGVIWPLVTLCVLMLIVVGLRLWARRIKGLALGLDDWLIIACTPLVIGAVICAICAVIIGKVGEHIEVVAVIEPDAVIRSLQTLFAVEWIYLIELTLAKLSILAMYWRIFPAGFVVVRRGCIILSTLALAWFGSSATLACTQCQPLEKTWNQAIPGRCLDPAMLALGNAVPNMVIDLAILVLPMYDISRLHMARAQKIAIAAIFLLSFFTSLVSGIRLIFLVRLFRTGISMDVTVTICAIWILTVIEGEFAVICACLPLLRPVLPKLFGWAMAGPSVRSGRKEEASSIVLEVMTIGGSGGSYRTPRRLAEDTDIEIGLASCQGDSCKTYV